MNELKPCPFCGGEAKLSYQIYEYDCAKSETYCIVACNTDGCYCEFDYEASLETEKEAIDQWNKRIL